MVILPNLMENYMKKKSLYFLCALVACVLSCGKSNKGNTTQQQSTESKITLAECPVFSADSALRFVVEQCNFGPRVTGSEASARCGDYLVESFRMYGAAVEEQCATVTRYDGQRLPIRNIIARLNPSAEKRIMLCSHWDSRPWADHDEDESNHHTPILGANDGASGVAVMMELCRIMQLKPLGIGVDFVCFDAEDMGLPEWDDDYSGDSSDTWCLGSRYWSEQAAAVGYKARYGILLDMVGGIGCTFSREMVSRHFADPLVSRVWTIAGQLGFRHYFPQSDGGYLTDDHVNVNTIARIPCIDIVPYFTDGPSSFGPTWHTMQDTPENIDVNVLQAVGQTLAQLLYNEK